MSYTEQVEVINILHDIDTVTPGRNNSSNLIYWQSGGLYKNEATTRQGIAKCDDRCLVMATHSKQFKFPGLAVVESVAEGAQMLDGI